MSNVSYDIDAKISKIERIVLEQLRWILPHKYGTLVVKIDGGKVVEILPTPSVLKEELKEAQA
jgi:hypothetical protein